MTRSAGHDDDALRPTVPPGSSGREAASGRTDGRFASPAEPFAGIPSRASRQRGGGAPMSTRGRSIHDDGATTPGRFPLQSRATRRRLRRRARRLSRPAPLLPATRPLGPVSSSSRWTSLAGARVRAETASATRCVLVAKPRWTPLKTGSGISTMSYTSAHGNSIRSTTVPAFEDRRHHRAGPSGRRRDGRVDAHRRKGR